MTSRRIRWGSLLGAVTWAAVGCAGQVNPVHLASEPSRPAPAPAPTAAPVALPVVAAAPAAVAAAPGRSSSGGSAQAPARAPAQVVAAGPPAQPAPPPPARTVNIPASTQIASVHGEIAHYPYPGAPSDGTIPATWFGYPSVLPVVDQAPGWVEVRLAQRPNMSVTWVRTRDVDLTPTIYHLVLDLPSMHLTLFESGQPVLSLPAGIGTPDDPTPTGTYFVAFQAPPPDAGYGQFVLVTSAHSNAINNWEGMGDAVTGIHGPITARDDARIGTTGARISHGCIRLHDADLARLAGVPAGAPLDIIG